MSGYVLLLTEGTIETLMNIIELYKCSLIIGG